MNEKIVLNFDLSALALHPKIKMTQGKLKEICNHALSNYIIM